MPRLAQAGVRVVVASRTEVDTSSKSDFQRYASGTIHQTAETIREQGGAAVGVKCDLSRSEEIQSWSRPRWSTSVASTSWFPTRASTAKRRCRDLGVDLLDRCLAVNVRAPLLLCKYALPAMIAQNAGGSVFAITSGSARTYRSGRVAYSMSKAALERMFLSVAEEVRSENIAVNLFGPGRVDTWMNRRGDWPGTAHIPMVQPEEVIPAAVWLAGQTAQTSPGAGRRAVRFRRYLGRCRGLNAKPTRPQQLSNSHRPLPLANPQISNAGNLLP